MSRLNEIKQILSFVPTQYFVIGPAMLHYMTGIFLGEILFMIGTCRKYKLKNILFLEKAVPLASFCSIFMSLLYSNKPKGKDKKEHETPPLIPPLIITCKSKKK